MTAFRRYGVKMRTLLTTFTQLDGRTDWLYAKIRNLNSQIPLKLLPLNVFARL